MHYSCFPLVLEIPFNPRSIKK